MLEPGEKKQGSQKNLQDQASNGEENGHATFRVAFLLDEVSNAAFPSQMPPDLLNSSGCFPFLCN